MHAHAQYVAMDYFRNRACQGLVENVALVSLSPVSAWGVHAVWRQVEPLSPSTLTLHSAAMQQPAATGETLHSIYVLAQHRGKGHLSSWLAQHPDHIILTAPECDIEAYLIKKQHPYQMVPLRSSGFSPEYQLVSQYYNDHCAGRTGLHYMNHIDEGLWVLRWIGASELAMRAFCLHPLVQADADLATFFTTACVEQLRDQDSGGGGSGLVRQVDNRVLLLALEYRSVANEHLSKQPAGHVIRLSPLKDVNDMLIADKVQNRKDFELHHVHAHERAAWLAQYFRQWLAALGVGEDAYQYAKQQLLGRVYGMGDGSEAALQQAEHEATQWVAEHCN